MGENTDFNGFGLILIVAVIWLGITVYNQNKQIIQLKGIITDCSSSVDQADQNISDLNDQIDIAQGDAWSDYYTMGQTLEGLQTGDQVDNPCSIPSN